MPDNPALNLVTSIIRAMSQPLARHDGRAHEAAGPPEGGRATKAAELA